ncbi:MAG: hypothetical protein FJ095_12880 [Deltaproteobacteria bacterium]|nr:hypothetical protein [Deltaproteobacteria bacterium]
MTARVATGSGLETAADANLYDPFVAPRYDASLADPLLRMATSVSQARIAHLAFRTG